MFTRSILIALALAAAPTAIGQESDQQREAREALMQGVLYEADDRQIARGVKSGTLGEGKSFMLEDLAIDPDKDYLLIGLCDPDECTEMHLDVLDAKGEGLDLSDDNSSISIYNRPAIFVKAGRAGNLLRVKVTMIECDDNPCTWAVGTFLANEQQR